MQNESLLRLTLFLTVLILMMVLETLFPKKGRTQKRKDRWVSNLLLVGLGSLALRVLFPVLAVGVAFTAHSKGWGLLNMFDIPVWAGFIVALILLDLSVYLQHVGFHKISFLWAMHRVHHADRDIDVTTGVRFHPFEIIVSMLYKMAVIILLGPSVIAVIVFEIILNVAALFNHANVRLPLKLDRFLRYFIITPDMHRVHHSVNIEETNRNYGFSLSIWDYVFNTYEAQPKNGHSDMKIGLSEFQTTDPNRLFWLLTLPIQRRSK